MKFIYVFLFAIVSFCCLTKAGTFDNLPEKCRNYRSELEFMSHRKRLVKRDGDRFLDMCYQGVRGPAPVQFAIIACCFVKYINIMLNFIGIINYSKSLYFGL